MTKFKMKNDLTGVSIKIDNPDITEEMVVAAYRLAAGKPQTSLFPVFSHHPNTPEAVSTPSEPIQQLKQRLNRVEDEAPKEKEKPIKSHTEPSRPHQVKLIGSENTGSNPIEEVVRFKEMASREQPREHVKAYINCPTCHYEGDRMTMLRSTYSKCPACDAKLFNQYAASVAHEANEDGYTYIAMKEMVFRDRSESNVPLTHREQSMRGIR